MTRSSQARVSLSALIVFAQQLSSIAAACRLGRLELVRWSKAEKFLPEAHGYAVENSPRHGGAKGTTTKNCEVPINPSVLPEA